MSEEIAIAEWEEAAAPAPVTLFGTNDPGKVIAAATAAAAPLADVVRKQGLATNIQGREHVKVEGWTLLGSMLGVFPVTVWTHKMSDPDGWEARVEARTRDGSVVGAAEAQCTRAENQWSLHPKGRNGQTLTARDDYALRSMAQTRATSKALRQPLGFVMQLAGFDATPAEEMPTDTGGSQNGGDGQATDPHGYQQSRGDAGGPLATEPQKKMIGRLEDKLKVTPRTDLAAVTKAQASSLIESLLAAEAGLTQPAPDDSNIPF